jgi:hypothetical protein
MSGFSRVTGLARTVLPAYAMFFGLNVQAAEPAPEPKGVTAAFGNTIKATYPDGKHQRIWLKSDGAWEAIGRRGLASAGKWSVKDGRVCLRQTRPFPAPFRYCTDFPAEGGVGARWTGKDITGTPIDLTLVKGIERP